MSPIDKRGLRDAFGSFPTGVTVVTTRDATGNRFGFTANSFSSVSLDPPMLLVCPGRFLSSFAAFETCRHFAVSVLAEGQEDVSNTFAGYRGDRFAKVAWHADAQGVPLIDAAAARFSCRTAQVVPAGDHVVLLGEVLDFARSGGRGLGYAAGAYFSLGLEREAASAPKLGRQTIAGAIIEHDGRVLLEQTPEGLRPPQLVLGDRTRVRGALQEHLKKAGLSVRLGRAYSIFDDHQSGHHFTYFRATALDDRTGHNGRFLPIADLPGASFVSAAHRAMLTRYALDSRTRDFGLYVGDEHGGDIHTIDARS